MGAVSLCLKRVSIYLSIRLYIFIYTSLYIYLYVSIYLSIRVSIFIYTCLYIISLSLYFFGARSLPSCNVQTDPSGNSAASHPVFDFFPPNSKSGGLRSTRLTVPKDSSFPMIPRTIPRFATGAVLCDVPKEEYLKEGSTGSVGEMKEGSTNLVNCVAPLNMLRGSRKVSDVEIEGLGKRVGDVYVVSKRVNDRVNDGIIKRLMTE